MQDIRVQVDLVNVETCAEPVVVVGHHLLTVRLSSHMIITIINSGLDYVHWFLSCVTSTGLGIVITLN